MDIIIIILLSILIILTIILLLKNNKQDNTEIIKELYNNKNDISKEVSSFKYDINKEINNSINALSDKIDKRLELIDNRVNEKIDINFEKTNKTFTSVLERLTKIDEAQKNIDLLSKDIVSLQGILTDKKTRGTFGEVNLNYILTSIFGMKSGIYETQKKLPNGLIADAILNTPEPLGTIAIDSKFPLENYERMTNKSLSNVERESASKLFKNDVKHHIDDIANKYIIPEITANEAIMFVPAEAIFAEINAYHTDIIKYAYSKNVWICGPTTLMSTLSTISMILKNIERDKYTKVIHDELNKLGTEFKRYQERWNKLYKSIDLVSNEVKDIHTTTSKISKKFESISNVDVELLDYKED